MEEKLKKQKCELVERLGVHFENKDNLAPVAARIVAYVILSGKKGTTFDDLVLGLCASKSTISTHLSHLQDLKKIEYFTKTGDRKRYFTINPETIVQGFIQMLHQWGQEKELHEELIEYKIKANEYLDLEEQFTLSFHDSYINYLNEAVKSITILKNKIETNFKEESI